MIRVSIRITYIAWLLSAKFAVAQPDLVLTIGNDKFSHHGRICTFATSGDTKTLVAADRFATKLWRFPTGKLKCQIYDRASTYELTCVALLNSGENLFTVQSSSLRKSSVSIFDLRREQYLFKKTFPDLLSCHSHLPNGSLHAVGGASSIFLLEQKSGNIIWRYDHGRATLASISISDCGEYIAAGDLTGEIFVVNWKRKRICNSRKVHDGPVRAISWKGKNEILSVGEDVIVWEPFGNRLRKVYSSESSFCVRHASICGKANFVAISGSMRKILIVDVGKRKIVHNIPTLIVPTFLKWSSSGRFLFFGNTRIHVFDFHKLKTERSTDYHVGSITLVGYSSDGKRIISAAEDSRVNVHDARSGRILKTITTPSDTFDGHNVCSIAAKSQLLGWADLASDSVHLWDLRSGKKIGKIEHDFVSGGVKSIALEHDGKYLAIGRTRGRIDIWDAKKGLVAASLKHNDCQVAGLEFSGDGKRMVSIGTDGDAIIWDIAKRSRLVHFGYAGRLVSTQRALRAVSLSRCHRHMAVYRGNESVELWDVESRKRKWVHQYIRSDRRKNVKCGSACLSFSTDGKVLAVGSGDRTVRIHDVESGNIIGSFDAHESGVTSLSFSPHGMTLMTGSRDSTIRVWSLRRLAKDKKR